MKSKALATFGAAVVLAGLALSEPVLARWFVDDTRFAGGPVRIGVWALDLLLLCGGLAIIASRGRELGSNLALAMASLVLVIPFGEALFRIGIASGSPTFRDPRLYAGWCDDDDQWKLRHRWIPASAQSLTRSGFIFDPDLGWVSERPQIAASVDLDLVAANDILVYGDSFVYGTGLASVEETVTLQLQQSLPTHRVVGYAVSAYGIDQIYLRFQESHGTHPDPIVVFGMMTLNLDRSLFRVRDAPKPYFSVENDLLELEGVPLTDDRDAWHAANPPSIRSYFMSFALRRLRTAKPGVPETEIPYRREEKKVLNQRIFEAFAEQVRSQRLRTVIVLFYPLWELEIDGWRESYLAELFDELELPLVDTKPLILADAEKNGLEPADYYFPPPNNHPNARANSLVAEAVAAELEARFSLEGEPARSPHHRRSPSETRE